MYNATIGIILLSIGVLNCLQVIPERANITYLNPKYMKYGRLYVSRYGRKSPYYVNLEGCTKQTWANNITMHLVSYEFLHNEYRRSFVEFHIKLCDMLRSDPYIGGMLFKHGLRCPAPPGEYRLMNMTAPTENFPNVFPFEKGKVEAEVVATDTGETIIKAYGTAVIKAKRKKILKRSKGNPTK